MPPSLSASLSDAALGFIDRMQEVYSSGIIQDSPEEMATKMQRPVIVIYQRIAELKKLRMLRKCGCGGYYCPKIIVTYVQKVFR